MKLPTQKKILKEDLKGAPSWTDGMIGPINTFMEATYQALNKNITIQDNLAAFVKEISYKTGPSYPSGQEKVTFQNTLKTKPIGVMVMQAYDRANYTPAPGPIYIPWVENVGSIEISTITGLDPNKTYMIRLLVF